MEETNTNQPAQATPATNWTSVTGAVVGIIGLLLTIVGTSSTQIAEIKLLRADISRVQQSVDANKIQQDRINSDVESRLREIEKRGR